MISRITCYLIKKKEDNYEYYDNSVYFSIDGGFSLISGNYTVEDFKITEGQDPDHHISSGLSISCESNGEITFSIGRHGSDDVADWFKSRIPDNQTTFNHDPGKLNFAFIGTLTLIIQNSITGESDTFTFKDVAIAQGAVIENNWWFGGKNCSFIRMNYVVCKGKNSNDLPVECIVMRGGNDCNKVVVSPIYLQSWMGRLPDNTELDQIMMPGSHDAGMSVGYHCSAFAGPYSIAQSGTVGLQLKNGSRYFDIRVDNDHDELVTYHRQNALGCNGQDLKDANVRGAFFESYLPPDGTLEPGFYLRDISTVFSARAMIEILETFEDKDFAYLEY